MANLPQELLLSIIEYLPVNIHLSSALVEMNQHFGLHPYALTIGFIKNHIAMYPLPDHRQSTGLPPIYQYQVVIIKLEDSMTSSERRLDLCCNLRLTHQPLILVLLIIEDERLNNNFLFLITTIVWAASNNYPPLMEFFLNLTGLGSDALLLAIKELNWDAVHVLLDVMHTLDLSVVGLECLERVVLAGKADLARLLLSDHRINVISSQCLVQSLSNTQVLKVFLDDGRFQSRFESLLMSALYGQHYNSFIMILKYSADFRLHKDSLVQAMAVPILFKQLVEVDWIPLQELFLMALENIKLIREIEQSDRRTQPFSIDFILGSYYWDKGLTLQPRLSKAFTETPHLVAELLLTFIDAAKLEEPSTRIKRSILNENIVSIWRSLFSTSTYGMEIFIEKLMKLCRDASITMALTSLLLTLPIVEKCHLNFALAQAARYNRVDSFKRLFSDSRVDPSANENECVKCLASESFTTIGPILLSDNRVNPVANYQLCTVMILELLEGNKLEEIQDFLKRIEGISIPYESSFREDLITAVKKDERMLQIVLLICTRTGLIKSWDNSMVYFAAKLGCSQMLRIFMDHHIAPDDKCLQIASQNGHAECLQLILRDQSVNPNAHDSSSLLMALQNERHEVIKVLLEDPRTDVSCCKGEFFTLACKHGYFDIISRQVGALNVLPTVFHLTEALRFKHEDVAVYLLSNKIAPIQPLPEHLLLASEHGIAKVVSLLLNNHNIDPLSCKTNPFLRAVTAGFRNVVEVYLPTYPHLVKSKWLCLALDAKSKQEEILMLLLQVPGLDASVNNNRCIRVCLEKGYWKAVDVLLSRNEVIGQVNNPELFLAACKAGRVDVVEKLGALGVGKWLTFDVIDEASDKGHETIANCLLKFAAELL